MKEKVIILYHENFYSPCFKNFYSFFSIKHLHMYSYIYYDFMIQNKLHIIQIDQYFTTPKPTESETHENPDKLTAVNLQILHNLWLPDVEILNLKAFETHRVLSKLEGVWIDNDHRLLYALATRITFICPMKFNAFPMDIQRCLFQVRNFDYYYVL